MNRISWSPPTKISNTFLFRLLRIFMHIQWYKIRNDCIITLILKFLWFQRYSCFLFWDSDCILRISKRKIKANHFNFCLLNCSIQIISRSVSIRIYKLGRNCYLMIEVMLTLLNIAWSNNKIKHNNDSDWAYLK